MDLKEAVEYYENEIDDVNVFGSYMDIIETDEIPRYVIIVSTIDGGNEPWLDVYTVNEFIEYVQKCKRDRDEN